MKINSREKDRIYLWAKENGSEGFVFDDWEQDCDTYFQPFDNRQNLSEYSLEKISDLQKKMNSMWNLDSHMKDVIKTCCVAAFKERDKILLDYGNGELEQSNEKSKGIPDYIYVF